jgi:CHASE2 domain-containing sensor protein
MEKQEEQLCQLVAEACKHPPGSRERQKYLPNLAQRLRQNDRPIATCKISDRDSDNPGVPPPPEVPTERLGFSDFIPDADGRVRRHLLSLNPEPTSPCFTPYAFNLQLAFRYLAAEGILIHWTDQGLQMGDRILPLTDESVGLELLFWESRSRTT